MAGKGSGRDVAGNAVASAAAYTKQLVKTSEQLLRCETALESEFHRGRTVLSISVRMPASEGDDYLVTVRAAGEAGREVAFHGGDTFLEALRGVVARLENGTLKWREDSYERNG